MAVVNKGACGAPVVVVAGPCGWSGRHHLNPVGRQPDWRGVDRMDFMATPPPVKPPPVPAPVRQPGGEDAVVLERKPQKTTPPQMYQVVMLNDDYTPMEFVVVVIQEFFNKDRETAIQIMLKIHLDGKGVCGVYPRDIAATKVDQVLGAAREAGHPLQCVSEPVE